MKKKFLSGLVSLLALATMASCGGGESSVASSTTTSSVAETSSVASSDAESSTVVSSSEANPITAVSITNKDALKATWCVGEDTRQLELSVTPTSNITALINQGKLTVTSSNATVVSASGLTLSAVGAGTATITVAAGTITDTVEITITAERVYTAAERHQMYLDAWDQDKNDTEATTVTIQGVIMGFEQYEGNTNMNVYIQEEQYGYWVNNLPLVDANNKTLSVGDSVKVVGTNYYGSKAKVYPCIKPSTVTKLDTPLTATPLTLGAASNNFTDSYQAQVTAENVALTAVDETNGVFDFVLNNETYHIVYNSSVAGGAAIKAKFAGIGVGKVITSLKGMWGANKAGCTTKDYINITSADDVTISEADPDATSITVSGAETVQSVSASAEAVTATYTAAVTPSGAKQNVTWSVTDAAGAATTAATIDENGVLTPAKALTEDASIKVVATSVATPTISGSLAVTVKAGPTVLAASITVTAAENATEIDLDAALATGETAHTLQLSAAVAPTDAAQVVTWDSSNEKVATVDESGLVTAVLDGSVTITATAADGSGVTGTITLTVKKTVTSVKTLIDAAAAMSDNRGDMTGTYTVKGVILAISGTNAIVSDGTGSLEVYGYNDLDDFNTGDYVEISGVFQKYFNLVETKTIDSFVLAQTTKPTLTDTATELTGELLNTLSTDGTNSVCGTKIKFFGKTTDKNKFYMDGVTGNLSISAARDVTLPGDNVYATFEGYIVSNNSSNKYAAFWATSVTVAETGTVGSITVTGDTKVKVGGTISFTHLVLATETGKNVDQSVTWAVYAEDGTSATTAATIDEKGVLTAVAAGTVKVVATSTVDTTVKSTAVTVTITEVVAGEELTATMAYSGGTTNMDGTNQAALLGLDDTIFSAVGSKINDGSNNVGLNKAGEFRFYVTGGTPTCQLDLSVVTGYSIVSVTPNVTSGTLKVFVGENEVTATSGVFAVNSTSVTFSATGRAQAKVKSIAITYKTI
jgi:uncharacterized protein YjdB